MTVRHHLMNRNMRMANCALCHRLMMLVDGADVCTPCVSQSQRPVDPEWQRSIDAHEDRMAQWMRAVLGGLVTITTHADGSRSSRLTRAGILRARVNATALGLDPDTLTWEQRTELAVHGELLA